MAPLVEKLSNGRHPVSLNRYKSVSEVKEALEREFILVKFTDTQGGTEIGVSLAKGAKDIDITNGKLDLQGSLTLDYQPVKCIVNVDLETLTGHGFLEPVHTT